MRINQFGRDNRLFARISLCGSSILWIIWIGNCKCQISNIRTFHPTRFRKSNSNPSFDHWDFQIDIAIEVNEFDSCCDLDFAVTDEFVIADDIPVKTDTDAWMR